MLKVAIVVVVVVVVLEVVVAEVAYFLVVYPVCLKSLVAVVHQWVVLGYLLIHITELHQ